MKKLEIVVRDIDSIRPYEFNVKNHDKKQIEKIAKAISEFGWDQPIVVDGKGEIIKGHGRRLAAISLGMKTVPVLVRDDLTEDQVKAARLSDNRVAISDIDSEMLQKELASLMFDMDGIFDKKELDFLIADLGEMKIEAFVADLNAQVALHSEETGKKIEEVDAREIKIEKALGFKSIVGKDEKWVARFMAQVESETGLVGAEAFVQFVKSILQSAE
jgi:hypothetical protein